MTYLLFLSFRTLTATGAEGAEVNDVETATDDKEAPDVPAALVAVTVNVYDVPPGTVFAIFTRTYFAPLVLRTCPSEEVTL
jgi:hypothetical protein